LEYDESLPGAKAGGIAASRATNACGATGSRDERSNPSLRE